MKYCQWCDNTFIPNVSYQIYCCSECRDEATKEKIAERYAKNRLKKRVGKNRKCNYCGSSLSIYNDEEICSSCDENPKEVGKALKELKDILNGKFNFDS
jgi:hypothetical protein